MDIFVSHTVNPLAGGSLFLCASLEVDDALLRAIGSFLLRAFLAHATNLVRPIALDNPMPELNVDSRILENIREK